MAASIEEFKTLLDSNRPLATELIDSLANAWLGVDLDGEEAESEWDKFADCSEEYSLPIGPHSSFLWRLRVPELITKEAGWLPSGNPAYNAQERHPVTNELVTAIQPDSYWKFIHASGMLGFELSVNVFGKVYASIYIHNDSEHHFPTESEKLIKLIEEPSLYEGQVCRVFTDYVEVVPVHDLNLSPYSDDVEESVRWMTSLINPKIRESLSAVGLPLRAGLLLEGPPGSGKTTLTRRIAFQLKGEVTTLYATPDVSPNDVISLASSFKCCLVVFEDVENFAGHRGSDSFSEFLNAIDGVQDCSIMILATTNDSSDFDPALRRPGRIERRVVIRSIHPDAAATMLESRFPGLSEERVESLLDAVAEKTGQAVTELPPAVLDSLARHLIMLEVPEAEYASWARSSWEPAWIGESYVD